MLVLTSSYGLSALIHGGLLLILLFIVWAEPPVVEENAEVRLTAVPKAKVPYNHRARRDWDHTDAVKAPPRPEPKIKKIHDDPKVTETPKGDPRNQSAWADGLGQAGSAGNPLPLSASAGTPLTLTVWVHDRLAPDAEREPVAGRTTWLTHRGPTLATFSGAEVDPDDDGRATTTVTFSEPGEYVLRVRADNFNPVDSSPGDQCCWTNGYLKVTVSP